MKMVDFGFPVGKNPGHFVKCTAGKVKVNEESAKFESFVLGS